MKKFLKYFAIGIVVALVLFQLVPKPAKNNSTQLSANDISQRYPVPADVAAVLKSSCYDCHSNNTVYPWYSHVQPVAMWLGNHINDGKREINFSEFLAAPVGRQYKKMAEVKEQVEKNEMPLASYTLIHTYAKLTPEQKTMLSNWTDVVRDSIKANYPADSLKMPKRKS
jgi:hypothetical protein